MAATAKPVEDGVNTKMGSPSIPITEDLLRICTNMRSFGSVTGELQRALNIHACDSPVGETPDVYQSAHPAKTTADDDPARGTRASKRARTEDDSGRLPREDDDEEAEKPEAQEWVNLVCTSFHLLASVYGAHIATQIDNLGGVVYSCNRRMEQVREHLNYAYHPSEFKDKLRELVRRSVSYTEFGDDRMDFRPILDTAIRTRSDASWQGTDARTSVDVVVETARALWKCKWTAVLNYMSESLLSGLLSSVTALLDVLVTHGTPPVKEYASVLRAWLLRNAWSDAIKEITSKRGLDAPDSCKDTGVAATAAAGSAQWIVTRIRQVNFTFVTDSAREQLYRAGSPTLDEHEEGLVVEYYRHAYDCALTVIGNVTQNLMLRDVHKDVLLCQTLPRHAHFPLDEVKKILAKAKKNIAERADWWSKQLPVEPQRSLLPRIARRPAAAVPPLPSQPQAVYTRQRPSFVPMRPVPPPPPTLHRPYVPPYPPLPSPPPGRAVSFK